MVILDTSVIIDHLRQKPEKSRLLQFQNKLPKELLGISMVTLQELWEGQSTKDEKREEMLLATIAPLKIFPYTFEVAKLSGQILRDNAIPIEFADAAIAATAILNRCTLFTLNEKDFRGIKGIEFV